MLNRIRKKDVETGKGSANRAAMKALFDDSASAGPGILAFRDDQPIGWCSYGPRTSFPGLAKSRTFLPHGDLNAWVVTCLFIAKGHRGQGVATDLLRATAEQAFANGATALDGCPQEPKDGKMADVFAWMGTASAFRSAGFTEVARHASTRPVMRKTCR